MAELQVISRKNSNLWCFLFSKRVYPLIIQILMRNYAGAQRKKDSKFWVICQIQLLNTPSFTLPSKNILLLCPCRNGGHFVTKISVNFCETACLVNAPSLISLKPGKIQPFIHRKFTSCNVKYDAILFRAEADVPKCFEKLPIFPWKRKIFMVAYVQKRSAGSSSASSSGDVLTEGMFSCHNTQIWGATIFCLQKEKH